ncbi:MAG TPA: PD-(D/E)XK nuclease family protein, partial [Candidatus Edwardsbacteria bacterium]|nr:PD-(D/E)XK nuclease family protein [Candidatus Edwardsbacteria bacterium]
DAPFRRIWERYFKQLYQLVGFSPVYDLLCLAVGRFDVFRTFPDEAAALLKLLEAVNQLEADGITSVRDFLDICAKDNGDHFGLELPEHMQGVQLMTFYKAKGMGFPVVINLLSDDRRKGPDAYYRKEGGAITVYRLTDRIAGHTAGFSPDLRILKDEFEADGEVQELNSLYVACTRAADELHNLVSFPGPGKNGKQSAYALLFPVFEDGRRGSPRKARDMAAVPPHVPASVPTDELPCEWQRQDPWNAARLAETRRGEFFHRVLQGIELLPDDPGSMIGNLVAASRDLLPDADPAVLAAEVGTFLARPQVARWFAPQAGRTVQREVEFIDRDGHIVRMDRLVCDGQGLTVIDFKTGGESPRATAQHQEQVRRYLEVLSQAHPGAVISGRLIYWDGTESEVRG